MKIKQALKLLRALIMSTQSCTFMPFYAGFFFLMDYIITLAHGTKTIKTFLQPLKVMLSPLLSISTRKMNKSLDLVEVKSELSQDIKYAGFSGNTVMHCWNALQMLCEWLHPVEALAYLASINRLHDCMWVKIWVGLPLLSYSLINFSICMWSYTQKLTKIFGLIFRPTKRFKMGLQEE